MIIPVKGVKTSDKMKIYKIIDDGTIKHIRVSYEQRCLCGYKPGYGSYKRKDKITALPVVNCQGCIKISEIMDKVLFMPYISQSKDHIEMYNNLQNLRRALDQVFRANWNTGEADIRERTKAIREYDIVR